MPFVIASSKHTDRNEVQDGLRQKHKGIRPVTELSGLGCPYPAEKQVAVDPAGAPPPLPNYREAAPHQQFAISLPATSFVDRASPLPDLRTSTRPST
ncbi:hypothetical protein [Sinorhizobium meliloti]|uniref:hypothetical protein n=1 Tax=Rhizobium meliloti TaxID=382 RepID=UPI00138ACAC3|nr:hypothetical protein [Sinorhizobium meliloti]